MILHSLVEKKRDDQGKGMKRSDSRNILRNLIQVWLVENYNCNQFWADVGLYKFRVDFNTD